MNKTTNTDRYVPIITALLRDVQTLHSEVYTPRSAEFDELIIRRSVERDGMEYLTKVLPTLGKALDKALSNLTALVHDMHPLVGAMMKLPDHLFTEIAQARPTQSCKLPVLFRELFQRVFDNEGMVLPCPDVNCVRSLRQLCFTFYKLELPYSPEDEQKVIDQFVKTESDISPYNKLFSAVADSLNYDAENAPLEDAPDPIRQIGEAYLRVQPREYSDVIRDARLLLMRVFQRFDPKAIVPKHGPGAVSSGERLWGKFMFKRINPRIDEEYPFCEYFLASGGALVDKLHTIYAYSKYSFPEGTEMWNRVNRPALDEQHECTCKCGLCKTLPPSKRVVGEVKASTPVWVDTDPVYTGPCGTDAGFDAQCMAAVAVPVATPDGELRYNDVPVVSEYPARVILVPKDSRGPRLISCEPLENQWIQQGLGQAIVRHVERHPLTRYNVHFTDQEPNRRGALVGSIGGRYATLDLKEASDRVTVGLVRLLFPEPLLKCLLAVRTTGTVLPSKQVLNLDKYAPMGSALCFPVMALAIWALLTARFRGDAHARQSLLVYGDDVIVPGYQALNAISTLESFGLLVNRDKSCIQGLFRESCGQDAFKGHCVTPVRVRTPWSRVTSPSSYLSYIAYANTFRRKGYIRASEVITGWLCRLYGKVPCKDMMLNVPALDVVPEAHRPRKSRFNKRLQKREWLVLTPKARNIRRQIDGWSMLLRYFSETNSTDRAPGVYLSDITNDKPRRSGMEALNCVDYMIQPFSVRSYTPRDAVVLALSWR